MAFFETRTDYYGLESTVSGLVLTDVTENKTAQEATGINEKGDVVSVELFGETRAPTCTYVLKDAVALNSIKLGQANLQGDYNYVFGQITINTAAGSPPTIEVTGREVPSDCAHTDCTATVPATSLAACHHAQMLFALPSSFGANCYVTNATYTIGGDLTLAEKDGEVVSYDIANNRIDANITVLQTTSTAPSAPSESGWHLTQPLTVVAANATLPTWTCTYTKYLAHDSASSNP